MMKDDVIKMEEAEYVVNHQGESLEILKGVSLAVPRAAIAALVGPSGSGKTTLLSLLAGVERPTRGRVVVNGHDLGSLNEDSLARFRRNNVGIVFQEFHLLPALSALENVALPLELAGIREARPRAREMLAGVGLAHRLTHRPGELSGGEQQRVAIARAFVTQPQVILADEPTGNLDQHTSHGVLDLLFTLAETWRTTLFLITHDPELAARANLLFHLQEGRLTPTP